MGPCLTFYATGCERPLELSERPIAIVLQQVGEASGPAATKLVRDALRSGSASAPNVHQLYSRMFAVSADVDFAVNPGSDNRNPQFRHLTNPLDPAYVRALTWQRTYLLFPAIYRR